MKNRLAFWVTVVMSLCLGMLASCGSDEESKGAGGTSGSGGSVDDGGAGDSATGGSGGTGGIGGAGGDGGTGGGGGEAGAPENGWKKGVVGKSKGIIEISSNAGRIQGIAVNASTPMMLKDHVMDDPMDGGDDSGTTAPDTTPSINFSGITPDFTQMLIPIPPYTYGWPEENLLAPEIAVVDQAGEMTILQPFPTWPSTDFASHCLGAYNTNVNGNELRAYGGLGFDLATCMNRYFLISNMSNKVWEVYPNGDMDVLVENLPGPSLVQCHQGELLISTLPQYEDDFDTGGVKPATGVGLHRVNIDTGELTTIVIIEPTADYADNTTIAMCGTYPGTTDRYIPIGVNVPFAVRADNTLLIADPAAKRIYSCDNDGSNVQQFAYMEQFTVSAIMAPNDVVYSVEPPIIEWTYDTIARNAVIKAYDGKEWTIVQELSGYEPYGKFMSNQYIRVDCPDGMASDAECYQPSGGFIKVIPGAQPVLYVVDPIKGELSAIPLDM